MDERSLNTLLKKWKVILVAFLLINCINPTVAENIETNNTNTATNQDKEILSKLENHLFFTTYANEEITVRLKRLEKRVFGEELKGSINERLRRLVASVKLPLNSTQHNPIADSEIKSEVPIASDQANQISVSDTNQTESTQQSISKVVSVQNSQSMSIPTTKSKQQPLESLNVKPSEHKMQSTNEPNDEENALDRQRVAVLAAVDQEIKNLLNEGVNLWRAKQGKAAAEKFEQVIRLDPTNAQAYFSLGIIQESDNNCIAALANYKKALQFNPNNKSYKEAIAAVAKKASIEQEILAKRSEISKLAENATAAFKRGEYLSALDLYKTLDRNAPGQALVKYNIGSIYLMMKRPEQALTYYQEALKLNPSEPRYIDACKKLKAIEQNNENVWQSECKQYKERYENTGQAQSENGSKPTQAPRDQMIMASFGILGKAHADGVMITNVGIGSRAIRAGLQPGDIVRAVDGMIVANLKELNNTLSHIPPGQTVQFVIQRGKTLTAVNL